jgi:hypothetical protein
MRKTRKDGQRVPATSMAAELKSKMAIIAQANPDTEMCIILQKMLDRGELSYEIRREFGQECIRWYFASSRYSLLDEIRAVTDDVQRALLDLLGNGKVEFAIDDVKGLNVYWWVKPDGPSVH